MAPTLKRRVVMFPPAQSQKRSSPSFAETDAACIGLDRSRRYSQLNFFHGTSDSRIRLGQNALFKSGDARVF
jgi:hypothetical protein